jgi:thiaminase
MFAPSQFDEASEQWVQTHKCEDFGSALAAMDLEADRLAERSRQEAKQKLLQLREMQDEAA